MSFDVAIIGGGIIGMMTAYELINQGLNIVIIDKGNLGQEASSAGGGILSALPPWKQSKASLELQIWSQQHYPQICRGLENETGIVCDYQRSGMLIIDPELDADFDAWKDKKAEPVELLDKLTDFHNLTHLNPQKRSVWLAEVANINNIKLVQALKNTLIQNSVTIIENTAVTEIKLQGDRVSKLICPQKEILVEKVVLAAGAWSSEKQFNLGVDIKPIKGQMISYNPDKKLLDCIVLNNGKYCIPRKNGQLLIGSTLEDRGFNKQTTLEAKEQLQLFAEEMVPELKHYQPNHHWAGLRPQASQPIISKHNQLANLYINTGHYRNGILQAPASGRLMRNLILNEQPVIETSLFLE